MFGVHAQIRSKCNLETSNELQYFKKVMQTKLQKVFKFQGLMKMNK